MYSSTVTMRLTLTHSENTVTLSLTLTHSENAIARNILDIHAKLEIIHACSLPPYLVKIGSTHVE